MKKLMLLPVAIMLMIALLLAGCSKSDVAPRGEDPVDPPPTEKSVIFRITPNIDYEDGAVYVGDTYTYFFLDGIISEAVGILTMNEVNEFTFTGDMAEKMLNSTDTMQISVVVNLAVHGAFRNTKYEPKQIVKFMVEEVNDKTWTIGHY